MAEEELTREQKLIKHMKNLAKQLEKEANDADQDAKEYAVIVAENLEVGSLDTQNKKQDAYLKFRECKARSRTRRQAAYTIKDDVDFHETH